MTIFTGLPMTVVPVRCRPCGRERYRKGGAAVKLRGHRDGAAKPPHQGADMGQTNSLSGLVLSAGAAKQIENPLMIFLIDTAAIVADLENRKAQLGAAPHRDLAGYAGFQVF